MPVQLIDPGVPSIERWVVVAFKNGHSRVLLTQFPVCGSKDEAADRVRIRLGADPAFRAEYMGWMFLQATLDSAVINKPEGIING